MKTIAATNFQKRTQQSSPSVGNVLRMITLALGRILFLLVTLILCVPILLLPIITSVPSWVNIILAIAAVTLLILQFRFTLASWGTLGVLAGILLVSLIVVVASQFFASTPPILDANGQPVPGSIATLEKININGTEQWITIRGYDVNKPILLNLGMGGPGGGGFANRSLYEPLEKDFVIVSWDEPGTGKSYHAVPISTLTAQRFVDDAYTLTLYLRDRFHQDKIYVYGVSWTSILGVKLIQQHPELFYAYIGNGQMVYTTENDILGYDLALDYLTKKGDTKTLETLGRNGPPPYTGKNVTDRYVAYLDVLQEYMNMPRYSLIVPIVPFMATEYGYVDKINHTRGLTESFEVVYPQLKDLDFITQAPKLDVPVYIFVGRSDVNAMYTIVEEYYNVLEAPRKELIWLEGGHGLGGDNLHQFVDVIVNKVLPETYMTDN
ncbi:MAG TPA: alpha/beta hydrolase [Anaerolineales bacterium]|nr:alpha/beta hydrolase [Anaerolineales bacterium]